MERVQVETLPLNNWCKDTGNICSIYYSFDMLNMKFEESDFVNCLEMWVFVEGTDQRQKERAEYNKTVPRFLKSQNIHIHIKDLFNELITRLGVVASKQIIALTPTSSVGRFVHKNFPLLTKESDKLRDKIVKFRDGLLNNDCTDKIFNQYFKRYTGVMYTPVNVMTHSFKEWDELYMVYDNLDYHNQIYKSEIFSLSKCNVRSVKNTASYSCLLNDFVHDIKYRPPINTIEVITGTTGSCDYKSPTFKYQDNKLKHNISSYALFDTREDVYEYLTKIKRDTIKSISTILQGQL